MDSAFQLSRRVREQRRWFDTLGKQQSNGFSSWDSTVIILAYRLGIPLGAWSYEHLFVWTLLGLISYGGIIRRLSLDFNFPFVIFFLFVSF